MTDKQYPLLPLPAGYYGDDRSLIGVCALDPIFTESQMRAYVDADRASRTLLIGAPCIEIEGVTPEDVTAYRRAMEEYYGVKIWPIPEGECSTVEGIAEASAKAHQVTRAILSNQSRPNAPDQGEDK